ncbi:hypothetical protein QVD17_20937 [Tagetes erecta]|uniref:F-box domain-containing protein n=1 Tax=Tagetes erecta TaxID=13708 RepID=A0AAD8NXP1_TARER|nr:hypothetical protein QVD17_20937 [Tagetes erecta]
MHFASSTQMEPEESLLPDRISNLPSSLVQTILTLMPIRDAFKTTILSRSWRHRCVNLPKLEFDQVQSVSCYLYVLHVLLLHQGPVLDFSLCVTQLPSCYEIDQIILHLAIKTTVEKFKLSMGLYISHKLPKSLFSLKKLTHLNLKNCVVELPSTVFRFERLTSLSFHNVKISTKMLISLLSCCPILNSFILIQEEKQFMGTEYTNLVQLFQLMPLVDHLEMNYCPVNRVVIDEVKMLIELL